MTGDLRRAVRGTELAVAVYAVAWLALLLFVVPFSATALTVANITYFGLGLLTVHSQVAVARAAADAQTRRAWLLIATSSGIIAFGGMLWTFFAMAGEFQMLSDIGSRIADFVYIPFAIAGLLLLPGDPRITLRDPRTRLDATVFAIVALVLSWHFAIRPTLLGGPGADMSRVGSALGEWVLAFAASIALLRARDRVEARAVGLLLAGHVIYVLTDWFWAREGARYSSGHWLDALWFIAWFLRWTSARVALRPAVAMQPGQSEGRSTIAPALAVAVAHVLLLFALVAEKGQKPVEVAVAVAILTGILLYRQRRATLETARLAEDAERQSATFRSLLASATDYVLLLGADRRIAYASPSVARVAGALEGRSLSELLHPEDLASVIEWLEERSTSLGLRGIRCRLRGATDEWREVELRAQDRRDDPDVRGLVINGRDITTERALEARLGHARKLAMLSEMAGRIAHAFNNTLAVLQAHAEFLAQEVPADSPAREDARAIGAAADRGAGITRQLLGFTGRQVIRTERFHPAAVIEELRPSLERLLLQGQSLELTSVRTRSIEADRAQFDQVILNLAANARDAMPEGGRLYIDVRAGETLDGVPAIVIRVSDEGVGMSAEVRSRLFEPFFTTKAPGRGTGLGLAMVASIVRRAGGRVDVRSVPGAGTTFEILWPTRDERDGPSAPPPRHSGPSAAQTESPDGRPVPVVLLVDDDVMVRRASKRMLQRAGYEVLEAEDGETALEIAKRPETRIDLLLTDLMMPGLSGRDVIARFRLIRAGTPIICVTGYAAESGVGTEIAPEVRAIVAKPFTSERLRRAIEAALGKPARVT